MREIRGDALVAEFSRASDAACAALEFQRSYSEHLLTLRDELTPTVRVGISLGEVVFADNTVTGAGVVMAQRVEQLAEPGGICITAAIHEALPKYLPFEQESIGDQSVKGFDEPVRVYRLRLTQGMSVPPPLVRNRITALATTKILVAVITASALGTLGGVLFLSESWRSDETTTLNERVSIRNSNRLSIAVLPFANNSNDPEQEYFADGMTEDLINDLSRQSGLFVISRNSSFSYKGKSVNVQEAGRQLGVQHILEGSVRKVGNQVRINVQLIDVDTGGHMWAQRYDGTLENVFTIQDKFTGEILHAIGEQLGIASAMIATSKKFDSSSAKTNNVMAYEEFLQGWALYNQPSPENFVAATAHFKQALKFDPDYSRAHAALASVYWEVWKRFWQRYLGLSENYIAWETADLYLQEALKNPSPLALRISSEMLLINRRFDRAITEAKAAIELAPNDALGYVVLANAKTFSGRPLEAAAHIEKAIQLDPQFPPSYLFSMALADFSLERYLQAAEHLETASARNTGDPFTYALLVAAYGQLNNPDKSAQALIKLDELQNSAGMPRFTVGWPTGRWPYKKAQDSARLKKGLLAGGLPEG